MSMTFDINEQALLERNPDVLKSLLADRTTNRNIIWGTDDYCHLGESYAADQPILVHSITGLNTGVIQPRIAKSQEQRGVRTKEKAEVFTPTWLCNTQNNLIDEAWFGRARVFNTELEKSWETNRQKIIFPPDKNKDWKHYIDERRLEIACGEAPYLVSRYDVTTGTPIKLEDRIGLLDRKLRIVNENAENDDEWLKWAERAVQSIYGFEFQGDNLLIARENVLFTYVDYRESFLNSPIPSNELSRIARIVSWNLWQMDALTYTIPYQRVKNQFTQMSLFDLIEPDPTNEDNDSSTYCVIKDWRSKKKIEFKSLLEEAKR